MAKRKKEERKVRRANIQSPSDIRPLPVRICDNIAEKGIYAIMLLVPLTFLSNSYWPFDIPKVSIFRIFILIVLGGYIGKIIASREWRIIKPPWWLWMPILLYLAVYAISTIFSLSPDLSLQSGEGRNLGLVSLVGIVALYFLVINIITERGQLIRCLNLFLISTSVVALMGIFQDYDISIDIMSSMMGDRASATFGNPDFLFAILLLAVPVAYGMMIWDSRWLQRALYFACSVVLGWCILLSMPHLFGDNFSFLVALMIPVFLILLAFTFKVIREKSHRIIAFSSLGAAAVLALSLIIVFNAGGVQDNFSGYEKRFRGENTDRYMLAEIALDSVSDYPIIGSGPNTFRNTFTQYATVEYAQSAPERREDKVHNSYVEAMATTGWLGFLTYVFMQIAIFGYLLKWIFRNRENKASLLVFSILVSCIAYMAHTFFMFHTTTPYTFFWILIAIALGIMTTNNPRVRTIKWSMSSTVSSIMLAMVGLVTCMSVFIAVRPLVANAYYFEAEMTMNVGKQAQQQGYYDQALSYYREAIDGYEETVKWNGSEVRYRWSHAIAILSEIVLADPNLENSEGQCEKVRDIINGAIEREPESGMLYYNRGILMYNCGSSIDEIMDDIDLSIEMYPTGYMARQFRAQLNTQMGNLEQAIEDDEMATTVNPRNFQWILRLGNNYIALGDDYATDDDPDTNGDELYLKAIDTLIKANAEYLAKEADKKLKNNKNASLAEQKTEATQKVRELRKAVISNDTERIQSAMEDLKTSMIPFWGDEPPFDVTTLYLLAVAYEKAQLTDEAQEAYLKAIAALEQFVEEQPKNAEGHYMLGFCYERTGRISKAVDEYQTVLQLDSNHRRAMDGLARLGGYS